VERELRAEREAFRARLKEQWISLWAERFDDKTRAEGVSVKDYPLVFMSRGQVIFASRDAKTASFSEVIEYWGSQGFVYSPDPAAGGWGKFIRNELRSRGHSRAKESRDCQAQEGKRNKCCLQLKKGGRGWLHK
jgi:hypothetical protein